MRFGSRLLAAAAAFPLVCLSAAYRSRGADCGVIIDTSSASGNAPRFGAVISGGSAELLRDYKRLHPDEYYDILRLLFGKNDGAGISHISVEMGSDVNSSYGTEPSVMRSEYDVPDVSGSAVWQVAADIKEISPDVTVEMLRWSEPRWVTDSFEKGSDEGYGARFKWYKANLDAVCRTYGIKADIVSADPAESDDSDPAWVSHLSDSLKNEKNSSFDLSSVRVAVYDRGDNVPFTADADILTRRSDLSDFAYSPADADTEVRYVGGDAPVNVYGYPFSGKDGALDIASDIIGQASAGRLDLYEFRPAAAAFYPGTKYSQRSLITADTPWNGSYLCGDGICTAAHFTAFCGDDWSVVRSVSDPDLLALTDKNGKDITVIAANTSDNDKKYDVTLALSDMSPRILRVWESDDIIRLKHTYDITPAPDGGTLTFELTVRAGSLVTVTSLDCDAFVSCDPPDDTVLPLPFADEFSGEYGNTPLFLCTQGGAFEIQHGKLVQVITEDSRPVNWLYGNTPSPSCSLGDDRWSDYKVSANVCLESDSEDNFAGIGLRYNSSVTDENSAVSGYRLLIFGNGKWELSKAFSVLDSGFIEDFSADKEHFLEISAVGRNITAAADGIVLSDITENGGFADSGRISLWSAYFQNSFADISAEALSDMPYIVRTDSLSENISYTENCTVSGDYPYTCTDRSAAVLDTGTRVSLASDNSAFHRTGSWDILGNSAEAAEDGASMLFLFKAKNAVIFGSGLGDAELFLDNQKIPNDSQGSKIKISDADPDISHSLRIVCPEGTRIDHAVCGKKNGDAGFSFSYDGGGFALTGENHGTAVVDVSIDGTVSDELVFTSESISREAFFSRDLPDGSHDVVFTVRYGSLVLDSAETKTSSLYHGSPSERSYETDTPSDDITRVRENDPTDDDISVSASSPDQPSPQKKSLSAAAAVPIFACAAFLIVWFLKRKKNDH